MSVSLSKRLAEAPPVLAPGIYDALSGLLVQEAGFEVAYLSGASIAYTQLGRPDLGLVSFDHVADVVRRIRERVQIPLIVDADTGWGNALNVQRTTRILEAAGANAIQFEDQTFPKRCGHLAGKEVISADEMVGKIRAACDARITAETLIIARTDARAKLGLEEALSRADRYREAGADILFVEALETRSEMQSCASSLRGVPLVANIVEGGKTPLLTLRELATIGFKLVIAPGALVRALTFTATAFLTDLHATGSTALWRDRMVDFNALNSLLDAHGMLADAEAYAPAV